MLTSKQASETFRVINTLQRRVQDEDGWKSPSETEMLKVFSTFKATGQYLYMKEVGISENFDENEPFRDEVV